MYKQMERRTVCDAMGQKQYSFVETCTTGEGEQEISFEYKEKSEIVIGLGKGGGCGNAW